MTQSQTQPNSQNKFAALDQKVSDSRENEKLQAQQQSPDKSGDEKQAETNPQSPKPVSPAPQQGDKPASNS